jgi:WS/DGAT/MGAT family acyltransferase
MPAEQQSALSGLGSLYVDFLRRQVDALSKFPDVLRAANNLLLPKIPEGAKLGDLLPKGELPKLPPIISPRTILNVQITGERSYAARSLPLAPARRLAKAAGAKLNDIVMATCAGALRRYLQDRKGLPKRALVAFVPISLRELGNTDMSNQVSGMLCSLATNIADPVARLKAIVDSSKTSKSFAAQIKDATPGDYSFIGAPVVLSTLSKLYGRSGIANWVNPPCNVVISNVPGPPVPLFCAEAKVSGLYPVSIPTHGVALNLTVQSYVDHLDFGLTADRRAVPDIDHLADYLAISFQELADAIAPPSAAPPPPAKEEAPAQSGVVPIREKKRAQA